MATGAPKLPVGVSLKLGVGKFLVLNFDNDFNMVAGMWDQNFWSGWTGCVEAYGAGVYHIFMDSCKHNWWFHYDGLVEFSKCGIMRRFLTNFDMRVPNAIANEPCWDTTLMVQPYQFQKRATLVVIGEPENMWDML